MPMDIATYARLGLDQPTPAEVNGRSNADIRTSLDHPGDAAYNPCSEAFPEEDTAAGTLTRYRDWDQSRIYPDTLRDLYVYLPARLDPRDPVDLIVCNDGVGYSSLNGDVRATRVLDSLHARNEIRQTMGVFVNPGRPADAGTERSSSDYNAAMRQRSLEYDALTPDYGNFLESEVLPFVAREHRIRITLDPTRRTICGISSGGICAFTVGWLHTRSYQRVLSHCGSFTNILGGHNYPYLVRTTPSKPLRVFLQSGANDAQTLFGDWALANQTMANALAYAGYEHRFEFGTGGHSLRHGGAIFADSLRWLWGSSDQQPGDRP